VAFGSVKQLFFKRISRGLLHRYAYTEESGIVELMQCLGNY